MLTVGLFDPLWEAGGPLFRNASLGSHPSTNNPPGVARPTSNSNDGPFGLKKVAEVLKSRLESTIRAG
jgi:hypothetical protein